MRDSLIEFISNSPEETFNIGKQISKKLAKGALIALSGELGSGKTQLTKGIAFGLGIEEMITSPTYTIINQYDFNLTPNETELKRIKTNEFKNDEEVIFCTLNPVPCTLFHIDTYRLNDEKEFEDIGGLEILNSKGVCVIEWADKIKNLLPKNTISINIDFLLGDSRKITIEGIDK